MPTVNEMNTFSTVTFEVVTAVGVKITVFWYVAPRGF
jgi:hypothetical protein